MMRVLQWRMTLELDQGNKHPSLGDEDAVESLRKIANARVINFGDTAVERCLCMNPVWTKYFFLRS